MEITNAHKRDFALRYYEMDGRGEATPVTMLSLLEETAFSHCEESGWDIYRLIAEGYGWILLRGCMEMGRYPAYREPFSIQSWCSATKGFYGTREYRVLARDGSVLGYARSLWLFYSLERRRPVPVLGEIVRAWSPGGPRAGAMDLAEVAGPEPAAIDPERSFRVRLADIDTNGHVNNVNYLAWALETMPPDLREDRFLHRIRGQFKREVAFGSTVRAAMRPEGEEGGYVHGAFARAPDGATEDYLAAAAESLWLPREPDQRSMPRLGRALPGRV